MTTINVKVDVDTETDRIAVWKEGIGWVEMDRGWFAELLSKQYTEDEMEEALKERDDAIDMADRLSWAIAPMEVIGEHSSGNDPWTNALDEAYVLHARAAAIRDAYQYVGHRGGCRMWPSEGFPCDCGASEVRAKLRSLLPHASPVPASHEDAE